MNDSKVKSLICATDSGREGELIFRLVYNQAKCTKPFERLWTSSLEDKAIFDSMQNLKNGADFDNLYYSADCRDKADWLIGMNLSRLFSLVYKGKLAIGRVKTPTLAMIATRDSDIKLFQKSTTYSTSLDLGEFSVASKKFVEQKQAESLSHLCSKKIAVIQSVISEEKTVRPPKLYDLTTLQREANRFFKYTAQQTLDITQSLYEEKLVTYPRTDSRYLTEDMEATALEVVDSVLSLQLFAEPITLANPNIRLCLDNSKVNDHFAIIPTVNISNADMNSLSMEKQNILGLIAGKLLCAVSAPHVYKSTKIAVSCEGVEFTVIGKTIVEVSFREIERIVQKKRETEKVVTLPTISKGDELTIVTTSVQSHDTSPPKAFTEDTLLSAMERAGDANYNDDTEKKGIGTPATRASVIEGLVKDGYVTRLKNQLEPTKIGINLVSVVPEIIRSPKLTAEWEEKLQSLEKGALTASEFMADICLLIDNLTNQYTSMKDIDTSLFVTEKEAIGVCPRCGSQIIVGKKNKNYYCNNRDCSFSLWENNKLFASLGKKITKAMVQDFLTKGETFVKGFVSKKTGKPFDCVMVLKDTGKLINFDLKFEKQEKR